MVVSVSFAQTETPHYTTAIGNFKKYYNANQPDSLFNMFSPEAKAAIPLSVTKQMFTQMHEQIGAIKQTSFSKYVSTAAVYKVDYDRSSLFVTLSLNGLKQIDGLYFREYKADDATATSPSAPAPSAIQATTAISDPSLTELPVTLKTLGGTLSGTLTMPKDAAGKVPVVLIIAGSGPTDRNCNSAVGLKTDAFKYLAEGLGKAGIASLRYDKRGVGQSTSSQKEKDTKFTDFVDDAGAFIAMLKDDQRFSKIIVMGHSEGAMVGMISSFGAFEDVSACISLEGAGRTADVILTEQMRSQPPSVFAEFKSVMDSLRKAKTVPKVDPALYSILRPSIQPYLITWIIFDPVRIIKRLKMPVLIIQGTTDLQVTLADAELLKKAKSEAVLKVIVGMNHILKDAPPDREKNFATYNDPSLPLNAELVPDIVTFIKGLKSK